MPCGLLAASEVHHLSRPALVVVQAEWLDLPAEVDAGRLCWTTYLPGHKPKEVIKPKPEPKPEPSRPPQLDPCTDIIPAMAQPALPPLNQPPVSQQQHSGGPQIPQRRAAIGHHVAIWWEGDQIWYHGSIKGYTEEGCKHLIYYDDGEMEYLDLSRDRVFWKDLPGRVISPLGSSRPEDALATAEPLLTATAADGMLALAAAVDAAATAAEPAAPAVPKGPVPDTMPIVCNSSRAVFDVKRTMILLGEGRECTPTEFERLAGKGASKKWKASLRVDKGGGVPGPTMGDWLVDAGLDNPKAPRPKAAPAMHAARRQQVARQRFGNQAPKPQGKQVICICVCIHWSCLLIRIRVFLLGDTCTCIDAGRHAVAGVQACACCSTCGSHVFIPVFIFSFKTGAKDPCKVYI